MDCFVFEAGGKRLGIEARCVYRVADDARPAAVPLAPPCHVGVIYYRGDLFDVVDAGLLLGDRSSLKDENPYVILLKWDQHKLGLIPERIAGMKWIEAPKGAEDVFTHDGRRIRLIAPEDIWRLLSDLSYGH